MQVLISDSVEAIHGKISVFSTVLWFSSRILETVKKFCCEIIKVK